MKRIGIISAMWIEAELIYSNMTEITEHEISGMKYYEGLLSGVKVVLTVCGIGKINAAIYTQILIDYFKVNAIIHTGVAGAMDSSVKHLDVAVADSLTYHDVEKSQMEDFFPYQRFFKPDIRISDVLAECAGEECVRGLIISGDAFITDNDRKNKLKTLFPNAICVEMEGCAVAHSAFVNKVPFGVIRCISDLADGNASKDYPDFEKLAAQKAADIVKCAVKKIIEQGN